MFRFALVLAACSATAPASVVDKAQPTQPQPIFVEVPLDDAAPGLSGLATDDANHLWAVSERSGLAYQITLDDQRTPTVVAVPVVNAPKGMDLEGMAWLGNHRFALGTEGRHAGEIKILFARHANDTLIVEDDFVLSSADVGVELAANHGAEGICAVPGRIVVAFETVKVVDGKRWAPVVIVEERKVTRAYRLALTSETGKLAGLDCRIGADGALEVLAIERHFEVTKLLTFTLGESLDITPRIALDIGQVLLGRINLEGIAWYGGSVVAVVDNQWKTITGPSELLVFRKGALP